MTQSTFKSVYISIDTATDGDSSAIQLIDAESKTVIFTWTPESKSLLEAYQAKEFERIHAEEVAVLYTEAFHTCKTGKSLKEMIGLPDEIYAEWVRDAGMPELLAGIDSAVNPVRPEDFFPIPAHIANALIAKSQAGPHSTGHFNQYPQAYHGQFVLVRRSPDVFHLHAVTVLEGKSFWMSTLSYETWKGKKAVHAPIGSHCPRSFFTAPTNYALFWLGAELPVL